LGWTKKALGRIASLINRKNHRRASDPLLAENASLAVRVPHKAVALVASPFVGRSAAVAVRDLAAKRAFVLDAGVLPPSRPSAPCPIVFRSPSHDSSLCLVVSLHNTLSELHGRAA
jgi:hypothetical protein